MITTYKPEVTTRCSGDGKGGTKKFVFLWQEPNLRYGEENPFTKVRNLNKLVDRQETRYFIGWASAHQYAELKESHLARTYADHQWPEIKTTSVKC